MAVIWTTGTAVNSDKPVAIAMTSGTVWNPGSSVFSPNGRFEFFFHPDGYVQLYDFVASVARWTQGFGSGADQFVMQTDGNLVLYAGSTPVWASGTGPGHPGAFLEIQDNGSVFIREPLEDLPIWTIPPDWRNGVVETFEWQTSILSSPFGVEQRFATRLSPRQYFEIGFTVVGPMRTFFDMLATRRGGLSFYMPLWHEFEKLSAIVTSGSTVITVNHTDFTEFLTAKAILIQASDPFTYDFLEISSVGSSSITVLSPTTISWAAGTRVYPVKKCRISTQSAATRKGDRGYQVNVKFVSLEKNPSVDAVTFTNYLDKYVLELPPNDATELAYTYDHLVAEIDNSAGIPQRVDISGVLNQQYTWFAKGREQLSELRGLLFGLQGRLTPIWLPTFFEDFELAAPVVAGDSGLVVKACGYTYLGGPSFQREHILIELRSGARIYRQITDAALADGETEVLTLDNTIGFDIDPTDVRRISFLVLGRLNQDSIDLEHHTDTKGVTTVSAVFKSFADRDSILDHETAAPPDVPNTTPPATDGLGRGRTPAFGGPSLFTSVSFDSDTSGTHSRLTTVEADDVILVGIAYEFPGTAGVTSVVSTSGLSFRRIGQGLHGSGEKVGLEFWLANANGVLTSENITANFSGGVHVAGIWALALKGANRNAPNDPGVPTAEFGESDSPVPSVEISTEHPYDILIFGTSSAGSASNWGAPTGFTSVFADQNTTLHAPFPLAWALSYKAVSTLLTNDIVAPNLAGGAGGACMLAAIRNSP